MEVKELLRVVTLRRGKVKPAEFRLREGERGLSVFARADDPGPAAVLEAVREAGKQGDLGVAAIPAAYLWALGLVLVRTPGGTPSPEVNRLHHEARLPLLRRLWLRLSFHNPRDYFNEELSPKICAVARLLE